MRHRHISDRSVISKEMDLGSGPRGEMVRTRARVLLGALGRDGFEHTSGKVVLSELERLLIPADPGTMWLSLAVLSGRLPEAHAVERATRTAELDGPIEALAAEGMLRRPRLLDGRDTKVRVEVVANAVVVDVNHTAQTTFATGIQRVARETVRRWTLTHRVILAGWNKNYTALRRLDASERQRAMTGKPKRHVENEASKQGMTVLVPWRSVYLLPELAAEPGRTSRIQSLAQFSGNATGVIGFDCVPLSSAETIADGMGAGFAGNLSAVKHMTRVATISDAAAVEYRGWRKMLVGAGLPGPNIEAITLPNEAIESSESALGGASSTLPPGGDLPMVLVVGSHEPRKNHLAVLHAAELLWRNGDRFSLIFVGGNAWNSGPFQDRLAELQAADRPVKSVSALSDESLCAAYRHARCVLFPSLNEGYGLPVAEALASGTPVVTSAYGSMAEIAKPGGALLVDPRDDHDIAQALHRLIADDELHSQLAAEAAASPRRTWEEYAAESWAYLVDGLVPPSDAGGRAAHVKESYG